MLAVAAPWLCRAVLACAPAPVLTRAAWHAGGTETKPLESAPRPLAMHAAAAPPWHPARHRRLSCLPWRQNHRHDDYDDGACQSCAWHDVVVWQSRGRCRWLPRDCRAAARTRCRCCCLRAPPDHTRAHTPRQTATQRQSSSSHMHSRLTQPRQSRHASHARPCYHRPRLQWYHER